ncbi:MAG: hypothetical protein JEY79_11185 [Pseudodesulfovibrio sp.]|nr:hypothetical protein [Pseudodesulfovibrio sp.]
MTIIETALGTALGIVISVAINGLWNKFWSWIDRRRISTIEGELNPHTYAKERISAPLYMRLGFQPPKCLSDWWSEWRKQ